MIASSLQILTHSCQFLSLCSFMWMFLDSLSGNIDWSPHSLNHLTVLLFRFMQWKRPVQVCETAVRDTDFWVLQKSCVCMPGGGIGVKRRVGKARLPLGTRYRENKSEMRKMAQFRLVLPWRPFPQIRKSRELRVLTWIVQVRKVSVCPSRGRQIFTALPLVPFLFNRLPLEFSREVWAVGGPRCHALVLHPSLLSSSRIDSSSQRWSLSVSQWHLLFLRQPSKRGSRAWWDQKKINTFSVVFERWYWFHA